MLLLSWGDLSALGAGKETGERHASPKRVGVSLSLLPVQEDLSALSCEIYTGMSAVNSLLK
jgi:hypothetical protein